MIILPDLRRPEGSKPERDRRASKPNFQIRREEMDLIRVRRVLLGALAWLRHSAITLV